MMLTAAAMALGAGVAGAQTTVTTEEGRYQLLGCYTQEKKVLCDVTFTLTKGDSMDKYHEDTTVFAVDGTQTQPTEFVYAGKVHTVSYVNPGGTVYKDIPVKLTVVTGLPSTASTVRALIMDKGNVRWDNIPVRGAAAPAPVAAPTPAPATINIAGTWNATLTNCKQSGNAVVCTATLRK